MPRTGTTAERGYGNQHRTTRLRLLAAHIDGTPCDRCGRPMYRTDKLDAAHPHDRPLSRFPDSVADHLECSPCNRGAGNGDRDRPRLVCPHHSACGSIHSTDW